MAEEEFHTLTMNENAPVPLPDLADQPETKTFSSEAGRLRDAAREERVMD